MSQAEVPDDETEDEASVTVDKTVEEALDLDFTSLQEVKEAFQK